MAKTYVFDGDCLKHQKNFKYIEKIRKGNSYTYIYPEDIDSKSVKEQARASEREKAQPVAPSNSKSVKEQARASEREKARGAQPTNERTSRVVYTSSKIDRENNDVKVSTTPIESRQNNVRTSTTTPIESRQNNVHTSTTNPIESRQNNVRTSANESRQNNVRTSTTTPIEQDIKNSPITPNMKVSEILKESSMIDKAKSFIESLFKKN